MAGFSRKAGYHVETTPKLNENGNPMRTASGKIKTVDTVTGREGDPEQLGVRLMITKARATQHVRRKDGAIVHDVYLTIVKANDCTSRKYMKQISARPELRNDPIIVHNGNRLDIRYQHEFQFSYVDGENSKGKEKLDLLSEYTIGPDGNDASVWDLIEGKIEGPLVFNAAVRPYIASLANWPNTKKAAEERFPGSKVQGEPNSYTSHSVVLERDESGKGMFMSKPTIPGDMPKHNRMTKLAADFVNNKMKASELSVDDISDEATSFEEDEFDTFDL